MTIKEAANRTVTDLRSAACRPIMPPAGGGGAMELPSSSVLDFGPNEFLPVDDEDDMEERHLQVKKSKNEGKVESKERVNPGSQADVTTNNKNCSREKNELYISANVLNRLNETDDSRKSKSQKTPATDIASLNQQQDLPTSTGKPNRKETYASCSFQERKRIESCQGKKSEGSFIRENIAGNNAVHYRSEELLPIQFTATLDGPKFSANGSQLPCATYGKDFQGQPGGAWKQCVQRGKLGDSKSGALNEIIAYAQNIAWSVKKLLTIKGNPNIGSSTDIIADGIDDLQSVEPSQKLHRYQSELAHHRRQASSMVYTDDNHSRRALEAGNSLSLVCGDEGDNMSIVDGEGAKELRKGLECESSTFTSTDSRPPMIRARTKVKPIFSSSRTKTFRSRIGRTRTDHELRNDSVTSTLSCKVDNKRTCIPEQTRKSGRTQTFDSSNLHLRKDFMGRSQLAVMQDGSPVDPPTNDDKFSDKTHKYAISRSATSPGTPGLKSLQREKSHLAAGGLLIRTGTKLTIRANKAAILRKENIHKSTALFHQQPAVDTSDGSPQLERKRGATRHLAENKPKFKPLATITEKLSPVNVQSIEVSDVPTISVSSNIKQDAKVFSETHIQHQAENTDSEIYCATKNYSSESQNLVPYHETLQGKITQNQIYEDIPEKTPYCDDLHHFGRGLENQLTQAAVKDGSNLALAPYFDISTESKRAKDTDMPREEETILYTDGQVGASTSHQKSEKRDNGHWYSIQAVTSKSSTHIREAVRVRSSLSDAGPDRGSFTGNSGPHSRKHVKYSETDVDSGTIYHMARRISPNRKVSSHNGFTSSSNFFETGGDVSKSSSSTSDNSAVVDAEYTGGFFKDTFDESDKKDVSESPSTVAERTYYQDAGESKPEPIECDIYTGSVFSPSANNLALSGVSDNWKNKSTNNSNRLPFYRYHPRTSFTRINNRNILNCSNNSNSFVERNRSASKEGYGPKVTQTLSSSYIDHTGCVRPIIQPVTLPLPDMIDFTKYDNIGMDDSGFFSSSSSKYKNEKHPFYEGQRHALIKKFQPGCTNNSAEKNNESLYTPGDRNTNTNNNIGAEDSDLNNNYFGDFYTGKMNNQWGAPQERRSNTTTTAPSPKYAPGSFYENAYEEPQRSPPRAQAPRSPFFSSFTGQGEPPAQQTYSQYSADYADSFSYSPVREARPRSGGAMGYEKYARTSSSSPKRLSYESDGYFDYHSSDSRDERRDLMDSQGRSRTPSVPKIKRVGAIICRENVANKDDYAEDVNRDLMEDSWIPISYRLAAEQVKEMGGGRCSSRDLFKTTEAKCDSVMLDASPFAQGQMLEALGRKTGGWNLKQNTDSLKEDISMKWRDAREKGNRQQQQQLQQQKKKRSSDTATGRSSMSSVWRPTDHIPAKAMGNRTLIKSESRAAKENKNNSNPTDPSATDVNSGDSKTEGQAEVIGRSNSESEKNRKKLRSSQLTQPRIPGTTKPTRIVREGKRARYPSKAVIEYPKLKMKKPAPPPPSPPKPNITATVLRGQDTLLISLSKNPEKTVKELNVIDSSTSPFMSASISMPKHDEFDEEVEAEAFKSRLRAKPLNCFRSPKWVLLEERRSPVPPPERLSDLKDNAKTAKPEQPKPTGVPTEEGEGALIKDKRVEKETGFEQSVQEKDEVGETEGKEPSEEREVVIGDSEKGADLQETYGLSKNIEQINAEVQEEKLNKYFQSDAPFSNRSYTKTSFVKDDQKANELIEKYLSSSQEQMSHLTKKEEKREASGGEWPFLKTSVDEESRSTYLMLSDQLKDAQRLMDMPLRKREKRLWKTK